MNVEDLPEMIHQEVTKRLKALRKEKYDKALKEAKEEQKRKKKGK